MAHPLLNASVQEIQQEIVSLIHDLEGARLRHPRWRWPAPMIELAREFQSLANAQPLDAPHIRDFTRRLREHIVSHRLKGFDDFVWYAEALERHAA